MNDNFDYEHGQIIEDRRANEYTAELLPNGYVRVDHHKSGLVSLIEPHTGRLRSQPVRLPDGLIAEIKRRWGKTSDTPIEPLALQLAALRVDHANLLAACKAGAAAYRDGEDNPMGYILDHLDEHGQMPGPDQHPAQILALCPCTELGAAS